MTESNSIIDIAKFNNYSDVGNCHKGCEYTINNLEVDTFDLQVSIGNVSGGLKNLPTLYQDNAKNYNNFSFMMASAVDESDHDAEVEISNEPIIYSSICFHNSDNKFNEDNVCMGSADETDECDTSSEKKCHNVKIFKSLGSSLKNLFKGKKSFGTGSSKYDKEGNHDSDMFRNSEGYLSPTRKGSPTVLKSISSMNSASNSNRSLEKDRKISHSKNFITKKNEKMQNHGNHSFGKNDNFDNHSSESHVKNLLKSTSICSSSNHRSNVDHYNSGVTAVNNNNHHNPNHLKFFNFGLNFHHVNAMNSSTDHENQSNKGADFLRILSEANHQSEIIVANAYKHKESLLKQAEAKAQIETSQLRSLIEKDFVECQLEIDAIFEKKLNEIKVLMDKELNEVMKINEETKKQAVDLILSKVTSVDSSYSRDYAIAYTRYTNRCGEKVEDFGSSLLEGDIYGKGYGYSMGTEKKRILSNKSNRDLRLGTDSNSELGNICGRLFKTDMNISCWKPSKSDLSSI